MERPRRKRARSIALVASVVQRSLALIPGPGINQALPASLMLRSGASHTSIGYFQERDISSSASIWARLPRLKRQAVHTRSTRQLGFSTESVERRAQLRPKENAVDSVGDTRSSSDRGGVNESKNNKSKQGGPDKLQSVDFTTTLFLVREMQRTIVPSRVESAYQLGVYDLALSLRTLAGNMWLRVSWHPKGARCHVGSPPPKEKEQKAYTFSQTLRALLRGLNVNAVGLARPFERVMHIDFAPRLDAPPTYRMYVEIMASRSNVILVAIDGGVETVAACAYQVSPSKSVRPLSTGQTYQLPPAMAARRPSLEELIEDFIEGVGRVPTQQLRKALVTVYQGTSPMLVNVMASRVSDLEPTTKVGDMTHEQWESLYRGPWTCWLKIVGDGGARADAYGEDTPHTRPWIADDGQSYYPLALAEEEGFHGVGSAGKDVSDRDPLSTSPAQEATPEKALSLQSLIETYYRTTQGNVEFDVLKRRCLARGAATLTKLRDRVADFERQLTASQEDKIAELNRRGDLLVTFAHTWTQGDAHVDCEDFETGERVTIEIKPEKTPVETAQQAFKLGKKLKRSGVVVRELLEEAKDQLLYAEGIEMALEQLCALGSDPSREELSVLRGIAEELGLLGGAEAQRRFAGSFGVKQVQSGASGGGGLSASDTSRRRGMGIRDGKQKSGGRVKSAAKRAAGGGGGGGRGGKERGGGGRKDSPTAGLLELRRIPGSPPVLVGRNNLQNERITFSVGQAHELWFHARGVAGAHVLLRLDPGHDAEDEDMEFAADVAVYFSKARQSTSSPVDYISPKAVKKLGSGGPGMVKYDGEQVMRGQAIRVEHIIAEAMHARQKAAQ